MAIDGLLLGGYHSGVETSIEELARALGRLDTDFDIGLVCSDRYIAEAERTGLQIVAAPGYARHRLGRIGCEQLAMSRWLRRSGWDLLHGAGYVLPHDWHGPSVLTLYDLIALQYPQWCKASNVAHFRLVVPASIARATRIVVPSETTAAAVRVVFPRAAEKVRVVPLGIGEQFRPISDAAALQGVREKYGLPERFILYLGNIEPKKNLDGLVSAYEQIAGDIKQRLVIAGGKSWKAKPVLEMMERSPARDRIVRTGPIAAGDLPALYSAAELLIQWSWYEGVGLPPLEAMACGTAALVSDGGALSELAGQAAAVVPLGPPSQLAEGIVRLLGDEERCGEIAREGRELAAGWTWEAHARRIAELYEEASGV